MLASKPVWFERTLLVFTVFTHTLADGGLSSSGLYVLKYERTSSSLEAQHTMRRPRRIGAGRLTTLPVVLKMVVVVARTLPFLVTAGASHSSRLIKGERLRAVTHIEVARHIICGKPRPSDRLPALRFD